ncbi:hypothetical protein BDY24DRAFT_411968 [Mrakia frigida]|uniref:uncharacterized protein n=1 Tax=Mrakia frigida TaxID=29902 RepID=UPI003FCBFC85
MAVGSIPDAPYDPTSATSYGDNFYPKQTDPNKTILPPRPAPLTAGNLWQAIKMTELSEFSPTRLSEIPCMRSSLLQGIAGGVGFASIRLLTGRPAGPRLAFSALTWFVASFITIGGASNYYCNHLRSRELELMRVIATRFPERNLARLKRTIDPVTGEVLLLPPTPIDSLSAPPPPFPTASAPSSPTVKQGGKEWVDVTDEDGKFVGRVSPGMAELAKKRGARERFSEARGETEGAERERVTVVGAGVEGAEAGSGSGRWKKGSWWRLGL